MKITETKTTSTTVQKKVSPFFQKEGASDFVGSNKVDTPFFAGKKSIQPLIQTKLTIGQPGDKYEREADAVADKVVQRMSAPDLFTKKETNIQAKPLVNSITPLVQTKCSACEQEDKLQTKEEEDIVQESPLGLHLKPIFESNAEPEDTNTIQRKCAECENEERLQKKNDSADSQTAPSSIENSLSSSRGSGASLPEGTRQKMESSFGADFSGVRLHTDSSAVKMNKDLHAQAFTHGNDIYFNSGKFDTNSVGGKHLLAHELSHTVQQGAAEQLRREPAFDNCHHIPLHQVTPSIQRSMGFEFQTKNIITTNQGRPFPRKFNKFFHKGKTGVEMQTDTGGVLEFETKPFRKWTALEAQIQEAVDISRAINNTFGKDKTFAWNDAHLKSQLFTFSEEAHIQKSLRKGEKLLVKVEKPTFIAAIQSTEGFALSQYESLLREHEERGFIKPVIGDAKGILDSAMKANSKIKTNTDNLRGLLIAIINYITRGQEFLSKPEKVSPVKARFRLMHRTSFSSMFNTLLSKDEKALFIHIVKNNVIPTALGLDKDEPIFPEGYWGHEGNMMALFKDGKIIALSTEDKEIIHDCSSKDKPPKEIDGSKCGKRVPASNIKIGQWLVSITKKGKDALSPPHEGGSMGKLDVHPEGDEKNLAIFETRGYRGRERSRPMNEWVAFAEEIFQHASVCRPRPGSGTELDYDGKNIFTFGRCVPHDKTESKK